MRIAETERYKAVVACLLVAVIIGASLHLRAVWDVAYARHSAESLTAQIEWLVQEAARKGEHPTLRKLTTSGELILSSDKAFVFRSHGLLCSVRSNGSHFPYGFVIRIGEPTLLTQQVAMGHDGCVRASEPSIAGGLLRSLAQRGRRER